MSTQSSLTGSLKMTGSLTVSRGITGSLEGTASWAITASYALNSGITGGTANYIPLWTGPTTLSSSVLYQTGSNVGIGLTDPSASLQVQGTFTQGRALSYTQPININSLTTFVYNQASTTVASSNVNQIVVNGNYSGNTAPYTCTIFQIGNGTYSYGLNFDYYNQPVINSISYDIGADQTTFIFFPALQSTYYNIQGGPLRADGAYAHAEGDGTSAYGDYSHAEGIGTIASGSGQHASGKYNLRNNTTSLFIVGNGTSNNNRSDVVRVETTGVLITGSLNVSQGITASVQGTASYAVTASYAMNGGGGGGTFPYTGNALITGSLVVSGSSSGLGGITGSLQGTASNAYSSSYAVTASYAPDYLPLTGGTLSGSVTITGSLTITNDITVLGSSSITYITSSQLNIGTNIITANNNLPSIRFGGLAIIDSGSSPQVSGSLLFDSQENQWIFVHQNQSNVTSSILIMGPETYNSLGNETHPTTNKVLKSLNDEHIGDSNITDNGTVVSINGNTEITGSIITTLGFTGSLQGTSSFAYTASYIETASYATTSATSSYPFAASSSAVYSTQPLAGPGFNTSSSFYMGIGAGYQAANANDATFIGAGAGFGATYGSYGVYIGSEAGKNAPYGGQSVFIGSSAGRNATTASYSVFIGQQAGYIAEYASQSVFIGTQAGQFAASASYSNLIGFQAGKTTAGNGIGTNNIIIGTNITLAESQVNAINIGGIIFGTGSYGIVTGNTFSGSANGKIGINKPTPLYNLDVAGSGNYTTGLTVSSSLTTPLIHDNGTTVILGGPQTAGTNGQVQISGSLGIGMGAGAFEVRPVSNSDYVTLKYVGNYMRLGSAQSEARAYSDGGTLSIVDNSDYSILLDAGRYNTPPVGRIKIVTGIQGHTRLIASSSFGVLAWMSTDGTGSVGIGVPLINTPTYRLDVSGSGTQGSVRFQSGLSVTGSIVASSFTGSLEGTASWAVTASHALSGGSISVSGSTIYSRNLAAGPNFNTDNSIFLGSGSGFNATGADHSVFLGEDAGRSATTAYQSIFIGQYAGYKATGAAASNYLGGHAGEGAATAPYSNFLGYYAGASASSADHSNYIGLQAGYQATSAQYSNFIGSAAGQLAKLAANSNFIGQNAGNAAASASYSNLIGYQAGYNSAGPGPGGIKSNNIIIGTNITLADGATNSINLGGVIFATGSYSTVSGNPYSGSQYGIGKVGINKVTPIYDLDVSGSGNYSNGLTVTGSLSITGSQIITGSLNVSQGVTASLQGTASYAPFYVNYSMCHANVNPNDGATYYIGNIADLAPATSNILSRTIIAQYTGQAEQVYIMAYVSGVIGTSEASTFTLYNITQGLGATITSAYTHTTSDQIANYTLASPLAVTAGDTLQIRWLCPTWATNPTIVRQGFGIKIKVF